MDLFEKVTGHCQLRDKDVEILFVKLKKSKQKEAVRTPMRCQNSGECPRSSFCKFVNPLTTRIPVDLGQGGENPAEAS